MTEPVADFINRTVGLPWLRGSDDIANGGLDCWGAVHYSFLCVDGKVLPPPPWRASCRIAAAAKAALQTGLYLRIELPVDGCIFGCYDEAGNMAHCGRVLMGQAYHANGSLSQPGQVRLHEISTIVAAYHRVLFYAVDMEQLADA